MSAQQDSNKKKLKKKLAGTHASTSVSPTYKDDQNVEKKIGQKCHTRNTSDSGVKEFERRSDGYGDRNAVSEG